MQYFQKRVKNSTCHTPGGISELHRKTERCINGYEPLGQSERRRRHPHSYRNCHFGKVLVPYNDLKNIKQHQYQSQVMTLLNEILTNVEPIVQTLQ